MLISLYVPYISSSAAKAGSEARMTTAAIGTINLRMMFSTSPLNNKGCVRLLSNAEHPRRVNNGLTQCSRPLRVNPAVAASPRACPLVPHTADIFRRGYQVS